MSWYSSIYIKVREYRSKNPLSGWFLARCLNIILIMQFVGLSASVYVLICHMCTTFIPSPSQATIYICIYCSTGFMAIWCLLATISSPATKVPEKYKVSKERAQQLKDCTPCEHGHYVVDKSTPEQRAKQIQILDEICAELGILQAECDLASRPKYCYHCEHMKPDRTHHCSSCGFCGVRFDHHCPWINHCVGYSNYKKFLLYVTYSTLTLVIYLLIFVECLIRFCIRGRYSEDWISICVAALIAGMYAVFGYYPLGELVKYHFDLISINESTCEQAKPAVLKNDNHADYNMGRWENFSMTFGWGLWGFPLNTQTEDGMHFKIRYVDEHNKSRYVRVAKSSASPKQEPSPSMPAAASQSASTAQTFKEKTPCSPDKNNNNRIPRIGGGISLRETQLDSEITQGSLVF